MRAFLLNTYDFFHGKKWLLYATTVVLFVLLGFIASRTKIEEDITRVLPNGGQVQQINDLLKQSRFADKIMVKLKPKGDATPEDLIAAADVLVEQWRLRTDVTEIKCRVDEESTLDIYNTVYNNLPFYLDSSDYAKVDSLITPQAIADKTVSNYTALTSASGLVMKKLIADDPLGITPLVLKKMQQLQIDEQYELYDGYMLSKDQRSLFLFITPKFSANQTSENENLIEALDSAGRNLLQQHNIVMLYYGGPAVGVCNAIQLKRDTILTLSITIVSLLVFTLFFFRKKRVPFVMMMPVAFGALLALAVIALIKGNISSIAVGAGSIVLGIAINYSIHFFSHFKHCGSVKQTISDLLLPMTIGSFTTVGSFFALTLLQSQVLNDFGMFAGFSLMGATIFALVFLPHFLSDEKQTVEIHQPNWLEKLLSIRFKHQGKVFLVILLLTFFFYRQAGKVNFDSDMNHFSFMTEELQKAQVEMDVMQDEVSKTVYVATSADSLNQTLEKNEALLTVLKAAQQNGEVKKYSSINWFVPSRSTQLVKWKQWNEYWTEEKKQQVLSLLKSEGAKLKFRPEAFSNFEALLNKPFTWFSEDDFEVLKKSFGSEMVFIDSNRAVVMNAVKVNKISRPELYARLQKGGAIILDKQIITNSFVETLYADFNHILIYTALLVFVSLMISYGRLELTLITFLPMLITWIWILGIMALCGLQFNLINIIISTFIFGLGDDFSIFTTDGLMKKYAEGKETLTSHKVSIFLCAATTIIGLGALIFAQHPALKSIALISIIGIFCVLFIGQTVQPFLFNFFIQSRKERGLPPYTFPTFILTFIAFTYYTSVSLLVSLVGYILLYLVPYPNIKKRKLFFHHLVCWALRVLTYMMANVSKKHIGRENMDFSKPAIIIANHASFLDILVTVMQHPKLILLTNKWVYYSPVFGKVVQLADYYPVMEGVDPGVEKFAEIVKDGYSIVIFPEGTRTPDGKLKRFHKGAFYLAEQLSMDIVPMLLHGTGDTIRKGDFMVMNAFMTMKFLPRISAADKNFGEGYTERSKKISRLFKTEYEKLREESEIPRYFRQRLRMNYMYKGTELEWLALKEGRNEKFYNQLEAVLPQQGQITEIGCGYGFAAYMIYFCGWKRTVTGIDADETKVDVAKNCFSKSEQINFVCGDALSIELPVSDVFVINERNLPLTLESKTQLLQICKARLTTTGKVVLINAGQTISEL